MANSGNLGSTQRDKGENLGASAGQFASDAKNKAQEAAAAIGEKAREAASSVAGSAKDLTHKAADLASNAGHQAEEAVSSVGGQMKNLAGTIREKAPHEGMLGSAAARVADTLETSGRYLQEENLKGMANDLTALIRQYPIQAILVGMGVGFLFARATRS
jgi:ElaB/YqjD/DUF883 family membrane-anchored ribosome-binding protein